MLACRDNKFSVVEKLIELGNPVNELDKVTCLQLIDIVKYRKVLDF